MSMPDTGTSLHVATLDYDCTFGAVQAAGGPITFQVPNPVRFTCRFETGSVQADGVWTFTWDYSWFTQGAVEDSIATALNQICASIATLLGTPVSDIEAAVTVRRTWTITPNQQGQGVSSGSTQISSEMPYPPVKSDTDACAATEAESV